jgi:rsbT co-antagonist protein RsbR
MKTEMTANTRLPDLLKRHQTSILEDWLRPQLDERNARSGRSSGAEVREQSRALLGALTEGSQHGSSEDLSGEAWTNLRAILAEISQSRTRAGYSPSETARFVFSLKETLFGVLRREYADDPKKTAEETWAASLLMDNLGLLTLETALRAREEIVARQQQELLELSTPVVKLWQGIVAVPLIGTLDSERTQIVMESLLEQVVANEASIAIIDITGVPTVDTLVAQHLLKTIAAARLMGAECIISGIRPQIAATIVHLGVELGNVITKANLADAFALALRRVGMAVRPQQARPVENENYGPNSDS